MNMSVMPAANASWHDIGVALGFGYLAESDLSVAGAAYDYASAGPTSWQRSFLWACSACQGTVIDFGPKAGSPEDREHGHAVGCPRLTAAVTAWDASWDTEDGQ